VGEDEFRELYGRLGAQIFSYAAVRLSPEQAKDVVNSTFEVVWHKRDAMPADPSEWPAWTFGIAKNHVLQERQRVRRTHHDNRFISEQTPHLDAAKVPDVADAVARSDAGRRIWDQLTAAEHDLLNIAFLRGLDNDEAAELLGITVTAYTTRVSRLRQRIAVLDRAEGELAGAEGGGRDGS
jgi:RNA polymerase sigma factor (sigma-70 family)